MFYLVNICKADFLIKNKNGKVAAEEAYDKNFYDISEFLVEKEDLMMNKGSIIEENTNEDMNDNLTEEDISKMNLN